MGRVKSEMFEDDLSADDELVAKPLAHLFGADPLAELTESAEKIIRRSRIQEEIEQCEIPRGTQERREFMHEKLKELMDGINSK